jgi:DsbC/DsbD-like thiol-disulfide interchange protein
MLRLLMALAMFVFPSTSQDGSAVVAWTIALEPGPVPTAGRTIHVVLTAKIEPGWHVYSLTQPPNGPAALSVAVPSGQLFTRAGAVTESAPIVTFDPAFRLRTQYFEDEATITVPTRIAPGTRPGPAPLRVKIDYQVCNDKLCLPPATTELKLNVPITVLRGRTLK